MGDTMKKSNDTLQGAWFSENTQGFMNWIYGIKSLEVNNATIVVKQAHTQNTQQIPVEQ